MELPYVGNELSVVVLLPRQKDACGQLGNRLNPALFSDRLARMHALRAQGTSLKAIAAHLNQCGWRSKLGNAWQTGHVASVLGNRHTARVLQTPAVAKAA